MFRGILILLDAWRNFRVALSNFRGRLSRRPIDYVVLPLEGTLPEYLPPVPWWRRLIPLPGIAGPGDAQSLTDVREALDRIADDDRPQGVILRLDGLVVGWSTAGALRQMIGRFRESGKRVVAYAQDFDTLTYYIACAANEIIAPPIAGWGVLGLRVEAVFLKEALNAVGIETDVIAVSPFKASPDVFHRAEMSDEQRENLNLILDEQYDEIVGAIAAARELDEETVCEWIDRAPLKAVEAQESGLIDRVTYLDELASALGAGSDERARLVNWEVADRLLVRPIRWRSGKVVGVVSVRGMIVPGESRRLPAPFPIPFLGNVQAGSDTVSQALRKAERSSHVAAVVLQIDSRGGSSQASDLIWREVSRLARKKPVVVSMGDYAASGAYYLSTASSHVVCQPLTLTGSIGVYFLKPVLGPLYRRLGVHRTGLQRGEHADLYREDEHLTEEQRTLIRDHIFHLYDLFKQRVVDGREIDSEALPSIAEGRIWLGKQALELGLVDELGDFRSAVKRAREMAGLPEDRWTPLTWISGGGTQRLPAPYPLTGDRPSGLETVFRERWWMFDPLYFTVR